MLAIAKTRPESGVEIIEVDEPSVLPGHVKIKVLYGSICGTDLHLYQWDSFAQERLRPPRIIGHEFCGEIIEVGEGVPESRLGEIVASESHVVCGKCPQCLAGDAHVCANTQILGIHIDGGFAGYAVIPSANAHKIPDGTPLEVASMLDAVGNGVHTVMDGPVKDQKILITGLGPIGLFGVAICKALGAELVVGTEIKALRQSLGAALGADHIIDPSKVDAEAALKEIAPLGFDATLEMSGHPSALPLAIHHTRPGGRISLLGLYHDAHQPVPMNDLIMKGLSCRGIVGRRLPQTWDQMFDLLVNYGLNVRPVITHPMSFKDINEAMAILAEGKAGKVCMDFSDSR